MFIRELGQKVYEVIKEKGKITKNELVLIIKEEANEPLTDSQIRNVIYRLRKFFLNYFNDIGLKYEKTIKQKPAQLVFYVRGDDK